MMSESGRVLYAHRLRAGRSLDSISTETRIPVAYLQALEQGDLDTLPPAPVLVKAYLRAYCRCLALDEGDEARAVACLLDAMEQRREAREADAVLERAQRGALGVFYRMVVAVHLPLFRLRATLAGYEQDLERRAVRSWARAGAQARAAQGRLSVKLGIVEQAIRQRACDIRQAVQGQIHALRADAVEAWAAMSSLAAAASVALATQMCVQGRRAGALVHRGLMVCAAEAQGLWVGARARVGAAAIMITRTVRDTWRRALTVHLVGFRDSAGDRGVPVVVRQRRLIGTETREWLSLRRPLTQAGRGLWRAGQLLRRCLNGMQTVCSVLLLRGRQSLAGLLIVPGVCWQESRLAARVVGRGIERLNRLIAAQVGRLAEYVRDASYLPEPVPTIASRPAPRSASPPARRREMSSTGAGPPRSWLSRPSPLQAGPLIHHHRSQRCHMRSWLWTMPYLLAVALATLLATILGHAPLFTSTTVGRTALTAARLVQFIGYAGALGMFWVLGWRLAGHIPDTLFLLSAIRRLLTPLVTLVTLSGLYKVLLLVAEPFLTRDGRHLYDWTFVLAIVAAAIWISLSGFWVGREGSGLAAASDSVNESEEEPSTCPQ